MSAPVGHPIACTYLIASHTQPEGVARLARTIVSESPTSSVFIHYDAKAGPFPISLIDAQPRIVVCPDPVTAAWGTFSLVELTLRSLHHIRAARLPDDWIILLSGQDYPVRPVSEFEAMLAACGVDAIMTYAPLTAADRHLNDRYGFTYRHVLTGALPRLLRFRQLYDTVFNRIQPFLRVQTDARGTFFGWRSQRSILNRRITVWKGLQWWALSRAAVDAVVDTVRTQPMFVDGYRGTLIPDESFFQTIVMNAPGLTTLNATLHYTDWPSPSTSPRFLTDADLATIRDSQQWFTRKIDAANDGGLRDALDVLRHTPSLERTN